MRSIKSWMVGVCVLALGTAGCGTPRAGGEVRRIAGFDGLAVEDVFPLGYPGTVCATIRNAPVRCVDPGLFSWNRGTRRSPDTVIDLPNILSSDIRSIENWVIPRQSPPYSLTEWFPLGEFSRPPVTTLFSTPMEQVERGSWEGWGSVCARNAAGQVFCSDSRDGSYRPPYEVTELGSVQQIATGTEFRCGLLADGTVRCKGVPFETRAANPYTLASTTQSPTALIAGLSDVVEIRAESMALWARHRDGTLSCVGVSQTSMLDRPANTSVLAKLRNVNDAQSLSVGGSHVCFLRTGGTVSCFGYNYDAQVSGFESGFVDQLVTPPGLPPARSLRLNGSSSCIVSTTNEIYCWGDRQFVTVPSYVFPI